MYEINQVLILLIFRLINYMMDLRTKTGKLAGSQIVFSLLDFIFIVLYQHKTDFS